MIIASFVSIFWLPVLSQIGLLSFIDTVGSIFGPLFGLIVCDYYLIKRKKIINKDIFLSNKESAYFYSNGWHLKAIYSVFIGFIFASSTIWNVNLQFLQTFSWIIGAFTSYVTYYFIASKNE
jgi:Cytosine/uracil/thiamine/allantoin permeases